MLPRALAVLVCTALLPLQAQAQAEEEHAEDEHGYAIRAGDRVTIDVYTSAGAEVPAIGGERTIGLNSELYLPYIGSVSVADHDQASLRELLTELYGEYYTDAVVDVTVKLRVRVTGSVGDPGLLYIDPTSTIIDAIAEAGGMTAELTAAGLQNIPSDQSQVRLVRDGVTTILNLRPDEITEEVIHMLIQSGDWIHVPPRTRSQVRDEIQFWGGILGFITNIAALIILAGR